MAVGWPLKTHYYELCLELTGLPGRFDTPTGIIATWYRSRYAPGT